MPAMEEHLFWIASRAAGTAALLLSSAAVGVGLTMGGRLVKGRGVDLRAAHEALSLATLIAIVVHAAALLGDSFLNPSVARHHDPVRRPATRSRGCRSGSSSGWGLVALGVSYYFRTRIGVARWKRLHRWTALAWLLGHRALARRGHRRRHHLVPRLHRDRRRARPRAPRRPPPPVHYPRPLTHMSPTMQARRARVRQIRSTVTAVAVAVFIALFATIYIQMAAGKDPALGSSTTTAQVSDDEYAVLGDEHVVVLVTSRQLLVGDDDDLPVVSSEA